MDKIVFVVGSQFLYGEDCLKSVLEDGRKIVSYLNSKIDNAEIVLAPLAVDSDTIESIVKKANADDEVLGLIGWMHTFSPSKMWIRGLKILQKPYLHLHTQANERIPYATIDMDFMNLNQSAHGDKEHAYILSRMGIPHAIVDGYYQEEQVVSEIRSWIDVVRAYRFSNHLNVVRFGDNMRDVAVTDGDKVDSQIRFGWSVNTYAVGDLVQEMAKVSDSDIEKTYSEILGKYVLATENIAAVKEQVRCYLAMKKFLAERKAKAFSNTFEDLYGMHHLPGLATQMLMDEGIGYAGEGDYKTAALDSIVMELAKGRKGATGFMEDYTYDYDREVVLGAHMLEVSPRFAKNQPRIEVHPLAIGNKEDPARLVFEGVEGEGYALSLIWLGNRYRLIALRISLVEETEKMPNLPVASIMWKIHPDFRKGLEAYLMAGGSHHTVVTTQVTKEEIQMLSSLYGIECLFIDETLDLERFQERLQEGNVKRF